MAKFERGDIKIWAVIVVLFSLFVLLQWSLWGERGLWNLYLLNQSKHTLQEENLKLQERNEALARDIKDLKTGSGVLEERAREELGMVKPGESFFKLIKRPAQGEDEQAEGKEAKQTEQDE